MQKSPPPLPRSLTDRELYTPANIAEAIATNLTTADTVGGSRFRLLALRRVQRLHLEVEELRRRLSHGLTLPPQERRWSLLLIGPLVALCGMMGPDEAAPFFVRHAVLPVGLSHQVGPAQRRTFMREMRAMPFPQQGQPLSVFPEAARLLSPTSYLFHPLTP